MKSLRFNLQLMILLITVLCGTMAAFYYLLKIPAFVDSFYEFQGWTPPPRTEVDRRSWLVFLMFTYTAPVLMSAILYALYGLMAWYDRRQRARENVLPNSPFD